MIALVFMGAYEWSRPLMAFSGALIATLVVHRLAQGRTGATPGTPHPGRRDRHDIPVFRDRFCDYAHGCDT